METATFHRVLTDRSRVTLAGGRSYMIDPGDITKAILWACGTQVEIEICDDPVYRIIIRRAEPPRDELRGSPL